jgi:hypothetical protein
MLSKFKIGTPFNRVFGKTLKDNQSAKLADLNEVVEGVNTEVTTLQANIDAVPAPTPAIKLTSVFKITQTGTSPLVIDTTVINEIGIVFGTPGRLAAGNYTLPITSAVLDVDKTVLVASQGFHELVASTDPAQINISRNDATDGGACFLTVEAYV